MNVSFEKQNELNGLLTIELTKEDYQGKVDEQLKKFRKTARIPGFRPGTAPLSMVKRMVGSSVLAEEVNRLASETLNNYINENKIDILGYPLASNSKQSEIDFENEGSSFTLYFDLGLAPSFELALGAKDKLTHYQVEVDDESLNTELSNLYRRYGKSTDVEESTSDNDVLKLSMTELNDKGEALQGGVSEKTASILPEVITDKKTKKLFEGVKKGQEVKADIFKVFNNNLRVLSSYLEMPEEGLNDLEKNFSFTVLEIKQNTPAEPGAELYSQLFGEENMPADEEDFKNKIRESLQQQYQSDAEHIINHEIDDLVLAKHDFSLPDEFLKRWLMETRPEEYTAENIDERFDQEADSLRYQLIREKVVEEQKLELTQEEVNGTNLSYTLQMFSQYGMQNPDPQMVESFAMRQAQDPEHMRRIRDLAMSRKVTDYFRSVVTLKDKKVKASEFEKIMEEHNKTHHNH